MEKIAKGAMLLVGGVGTLVRAAAATKPEDAISNLSAWATKLHLEGPASWLQAVPGSDYFGFLIGALMLTAAIVAWRVMRGASDRLEAKLELEELRRLRAHGRAREKYEKEILEVPEKPEDIKMGDTYQNNGTVHGNMGPTTNIYGKQPFQMTQTVLAEVLSKIGEPRAIGMHWVGSQQSFSDSEVLATYLEQKGFTVERKGGIGMLVPPLSKPIELRGSDLFVDSDR